MSLSKDIEIATGRKLPESARCVFDSSDPDIRVFLKNCVAHPEEMARINDAVRKDNKIDWPDHLLVFHDFSDEESQSYWAIDLNDGSVWLYPHEGEPLEQEYESLSACAHDELVAGKEISQSEAESTNVVASTPTSRTALLGAASIPMKYWVVAGILSLFVFHRFYWKDHECRAYRDDFIENFSANGVEAGEAEHVWYEIQLTMKFADVDCSEYASRQLKKNK